MDMPPHVGKPPRQIDRLLDEYAEIHRNLVNRALQAIALPLIVWSLIALLTRVPFPAALRIVPGLDWSMIAVLLVVLAYLGLSWGLALGLGAFSLVSILTAGAYVRWGELPIWQLAITTLLIGWLLHVAGRKIEGREFAPLEDLRSLAIGPAWLLSLLYRAAGLRY